MKITLRVGALSVFSTEVKPEAHIVVTFKGSRWFGWSLAIVVKDGTQATAATITGG